MQYFHKISTNKYLKSSYYLQVLGAGLLQSEVLSGMVFKRQVEGDITSVTKAKVAVYSCPVDITQTETKGTVLIKSADELLNFSRGEESLLEKQIKDIADAGVKVVVAGAKFGDMALHFLNKYGLMAVRLNSKFDLRRLAKTVNATVSDYFYNITCTVNSTKLPPVQRNMPCQYVDICAAVCTVDI